MALHASRHASLARNTSRTGSSSSRPPAAAARRGSVVAPAFKRSNNPNRPPPGGGYIDLPPLDPSEMPPPSAAPSRPSSPPPPPPPAAPAQQQPQPQQQRAPGFIDVPLPAMPPQQAPGGGGSGYGNGGGGGYGNGGGGRYGNGGARRQGGQQQQQQGGYDAGWGPPSSGGWGSRGGGGRNNGGGGRYGGGANGAAGFAPGALDPALFDQSPDMLLQELDAMSLGGGAYYDRWDDLSEEEEAEDLSPKYANNKRVYVNGEITSTSVRVQDARKEDLGVMTLEEARAKAAGTGVDVVLVNDQAAPPVVRLVQFGKYKFELERAAKQKQKSSKTSETKEVRLRPVTEAHDYDVKVKAARGFLAKGSKVKLTMTFAGREMRFRDQGKELMLKLIEELSDAAKMDSPLSLRSGAFSAVLSPLKASG